MNKKLVALLVASSLGLAGCGSEAEQTGQSTVDPIIGKSLQAETKIRFDITTDPSNPVLINPTYLAMDSYDGTLKSDGEVGSNEYSNNIGDPSVAMGKSDGWSTTQPIIIDFFGNDLDSLTAEDGFFLLETGDPTSKDYSSVQPKKLTKANGDFELKVSGTTLTVILTKPLKPASQYQFAVTSDLKDTKGNPVGMSNSYAMLKATTPPPNMKLKPVQDLAHLSEATFAAQGVDKDKIIYTSWFTTASVGDVLFAAKAASALAVTSPSDVWHDSSISPDVTSEQLGKLFTMTDPGFTGNTPAGNEIYKGTVYLPYFLETAVDKFSTTPWQSGMPSLAAIKYLLDDKTASSADKSAVMQQLTSWGITQEDLEKVSSDKATQLKILPILTGKTIKLADGNQLDSERLITRYSPVPKLKSVQEVEYTLVLPSNTTNSNCQDTARNTVSIFQHGITVDKSYLTTTGLADGIIGSECHAIFAIDHPLHGTRGIELPNGSKINANAKPEMYLNLAALPVARDNLRQSTIDLVNLRMSIGLQQAALAKIRSKDELSADDLQAINAMGVLARLNPSKGVSYSGHSLGGITGVTLGNIANIPTAPDTATDEMLFNINTLALANPGAGIPYLLLESGKFAPFVKGSIIGSYQDEEDAKVKIGDSFRSYCIDNAISDAARCYYSYENALINKGDELSIATLGATYELFSQFAYAAQSVLDTVDPINHSMKIDKNIAVYLSEVKGDATIPNKLIPFATVEGTTIAKPYSPFGGTEPLMATMKLAPTKISITSGPVRNAVLFNKGEHSSLLGKGDAAVTTEMHKQLSSLLNGNGQKLDINNTDSIIDAMPDPIQ